ncbi:hypothetical protein LX36DRAFT_662384 [Colletotrichum falcatum]|nr:hypothetical protein LX36DRAFT_662384 [Colletotrichum falcatum]
MEGFRLSCAAMSPSHHTCLFFIAYIPATMYTYAQGYTFAVVARTPGYVVGVSVLRSRCPRPPRRQGRLHHRQPGRY